MDNENRLLLLDYVYRLLRDGQAKFEDAEQVAADATIYDGEILVNLNGEAFVIRVEVM